MCYWKQWGRPRTKIRSLIKLGLPVKAAMACGRSSKGWWRSSKSHGINAALGLKYLKEQVLFALRDGWIALRLMNHILRSRMRCGVGAGG